MTVAPFLKPLTAETAGSLNQVGRQISSSVFPLLMPIRGQRWADRAESAEKAPLSEQPMEATHGRPKQTPEGVCLFKVSFTDANTGTAVGDGGLILRTTNGGDTWSPQTSGTTKTLYGVSFTDTNNGTISGFELGGTGIILRTTDGGNTWIEQTNYSLPQGANAFYAVSFTDAEHRDDCRRRWHHSSNNRWRHAVEQPADCYIQFSIWSFVYRFKHGNSCWL